MHSLKQKLNFLSFKQIASCKNFKLFNRSYFSTEVTPKTEETTVKTTEEYLKNLTKDVSGLTPEVFSNALKTGAELYLTPEKLKNIETVGFNFKDTNPNFDLNKLSTSTGYMHQYLKNMLLFNDYNDCFRNFFQSICQNRYDGLELVAEKRLVDFLKANVGRLRRDGYNIELQDLKVLHDYNIVRVEIYKNLKVNRYENKPYSRYSFTDYTTPLGACKSATLLGVDNNYFQNDKPYILAATMHVKSPMKFQVFNQNLSKKLHGGENKEVLDYIVRFETQMNLNDFAWVLPTQNKPKRLRQTRITDFNNVLRGNPYFLDNFDINGQKEDRYRYMQPGEEKDLEARNHLEALNKRQNH